MKSKLIWIAACVALVTAFALREASAVSSKTCSRISYSIERDKLDHILVKNGYTAKQKRFLLAGINKRTHEIREGHLNEQGAACDIASVRAQILGCLNFQLPSAVKSLSDLGKRTGDTLWGNPNITRRESLVIGLFHSCRLAAMETLTTIN